MTYPTMNLNVTAEDGTLLTLTVPTDLPSNDRATYLKGLWDEYVHEMDGHWKGRVQAGVPNELADDVAEAMEFMGAIVDARVAGSELTYLWSKGYWAHGF